MTANGLRKASRSVLNLIGLSYPRSSFTSVQLSNFRNHHLYKYSSTLTSKVSLDSAHCFKSKLSIDERCNRFNSLKANIDLNKKRQASSHETKVTFALIAGIFSFFQTKEDEEESELIMTIKRAVLMIQVTIFLIILTSLINHI